MGTKRSDVDRIRLPFRPRHPFNAVISRVGFAVALLVFIAVVVFIGRDGYVDSAGGEIGVVDSLYYASVTVTTTGYGDISAVTNSTRLAALVLITPARILFLILVVGTTVEVLTEQSRQLLLTQRWSERVKDHYIVCGFGATGQSATRALTAQGIAPEEIVVVDTDGAMCQLATSLGFTVVVGDATRVAVLKQAGCDRAKSVVVTPNRDDTAVLVTLTARELNSNANIVAAGRAKENLHLLRQSGADEVIDSSAAVGRLLSIATQTPNTLGLIDDLLDVGTDLELADLSPIEDEAGNQRAPDGTLIVEVVRGGQRLSFDDPTVQVLQPTDRLMVVRSVRP